MGSRASTGTSVAPHAVNKQKGVAGYALSLPKL